MKRFYILAIVAVSLFFTACEQDDMLADVPRPEQPDNGGDYVINPEDTAGIVVPEGYGLVVFPGSKAQTRASIDNPFTGSNTQIGHLQYLIYQEEPANSGSYILLVNKEVNTPETWPASAQTTSLKATGKYKVVFLGNVSNSLFGYETVLSGIDEGASYADAKIHLPSFSKFNSGNLFYWFRSAEFEVEAGETTIVPITLQRIVTRSSLTTYGIQEEIIVNGEDYPSKFYASLLEQNHPLGFYNNVFGKDSQFEKALQEMLERDIIFPLASCLENASMLDSNKEYASWYNGLNKDEYLLNYVVFSAGGKSQYTQNAYSSLEDAKTALSTLNEKIRLNVDDGTVINDYLEKLYKGEYAQKLIEGIIADDFLNDDNKKSVTATKQAIIEALKKEQNSNGAVFPTWSHLSNMNVQLSGNYPSAVNFDLEVVGESKTFTEPLTVALSPSTETTDKTLNIYLLGSTSENEKYTFALQSLSSDGIIFTTNGISGQTLRPNTWKNYRLVPSNIKLGEMMSDKICQVIVSYHHLTTQIESTIQSKCIKYPLMFSNNLGHHINWVTDDVYWNLGNGTSDASRATGHILTSRVENQDKVGVSFHIPDLSSKNLTGTLNWIAE